MAASHPALLATARLSLREPASTDPDELREAINDFEVVRWLTRVPYPYSRADAEEFILRCRADPKPVWAIHDAKGLAGMIGFDDDLGYWLARRAWGRGYATEAGRAVLEVRFADPKVDEVGSFCFIDNAASARVLQKLGFRDVGPCTLPSASTGRDVPGRKMCLTRADWDAARR